MSFYGVTDSPVLDFWSCLLWASKPEWTALYTLDGGVWDVCSQSFTSGPTPADLLMASMAAGQSYPYACFNRSRIPD